MNKLLKTLLTLGAASLLAVSSFAAGSLLTIEVDPSIKILVNGEEFKPKDVNGNDVMTFTYNGTTYAPLRALAEAYGLEVGYDAEKKMATVSEPNANAPAQNTDGAENNEQYSEQSNLIYSSSGTGDSIITKIEVASPSYLVFRTNGEHHHSVKAYYGTNEYDYDLLVNDSEPYEGNTYLKGGKTYDFEITCKDPWEIEIYSIGYTDDLSFSGSGDYVTDIFQPTTKYYSITYSGTDHFAVKQWYGTGDYDYELLVNGSGEPYSGTVRLSYTDYPCFFEISGTEGSWTITPAE